MTKKPFSILAWGCGLQSTTLGVMAVSGDLTRPDVILHTNLHWESRATRQARAWYTDWFTEHGLRVVILDVGDIRMLGANSHLHMPFYTETGAPLKRQCTREFKVRPARRWARAELGFDPALPPNPPPHAVETWLGFTVDEWQRMRASGVDYVVNRWPLIERRMTRNDCTAYLRAHGLPVPVKSGCIGCPYTPASDWLRLRDEEPESWQEAILFDCENRHNPLAARAGSTADRLYLWRGCEPLASVDLETEAARERAGVQLPLFLCDTGGCWT